MLEYKIIKYGEIDKPILNFYRRNNFISNQVYGFLFKTPFLQSLDNVAGIGVFSDNHLIAFMFIFAKKIRNVTFGNASSILIDRKYQGQHLLTKMFDFAKTKYDVITVITPVDIVINALTKYCGFSHISNYQIWFNPLFLKNNKEESMNLISDETILCDEETRHIINENREHHIKFRCFDNNKEILTIGWYSFTRNHIKVCEFVYVSKISEFKKRYSSIIKKICRIEKAKICWVDGIFVDNIFKDCVLDNKKERNQYIKKIMLLFFKKKILVKDRKIIVINQEKVSKMSNELLFNYLTSEFMFFS